MSGFKEFLKINTVHPGSHLEIDMISVGNYVFSGMLLNVFSCMSLKIVLKRQTCNGFILTWILIYYFRLFFSNPLPLIYFYTLLFLSWFVVGLILPIILRLRLIWVEKCSTCWGPTEKKPFCNCNIWVSLIFFTLIELPFSGFLA